MSNHLIIFIKNPEVGKVKTRIATTVGQERALDIYHQLLHITRSNILPLSCQKHLCYSDYVDENDDWLKTSFIKHCQTGIDLGQRMQNAFAELFSNRYDDIKKAIIVGSDCPTIDSILIEKAFCQLDQNDLVIGPTYDGGYYLLGMRDLKPEIFENISWSTDTVLTSTLNIINSFPWTYSLLPTLNDIDTFSDWEAYKAQ